MSNNFEGPQIFIITERVIKKPLQIKKLKGLFLISKN